MKKSLLLLPVLVSVFVASSASAAIDPRVPLRDAESVKWFVKDQPAPPPDPLGWPPISEETRPWTRWWWMGSAVNKEDLTRELTRYHEAGLGGVEITPIYGVKGREAEFIDYLSPKWMEMFDHCLSVGYGFSTYINLGRPQTPEQKQQSYRSVWGMGIDMANGTGWCFGGPNVSDADANAAVVWRYIEVKSGEKPGEKFDKAATQALMAYSAAGKCVDITDKIGADGAVDWTAPAETGDSWTVYAVSQRPSGVKVKRPAPGGAGPMLNLLYGSAMDRYLERFSEAFDHKANPQLKPHAMFHDSYEYNSNWAPDFFAQFEKRRGYKLQNELPALFGKEANDHVARVKSDYRETISDIQAEESIPAWTKWAHARGMLTREQAHGSPGNWLDIYAAADIPETEMFHTDRDVLVSKMASSAAHTSGKNLVGSESCTWAAEHFTETLEDLKSVVDDLFLSGVNRVTYHGTAYSPDDAAWPGWCFYASTEMNPRAAIWHDVPALNAYITRVQSVLQVGKADNDTLLYWPIYDKWNDAKGMVQQFTVHARDWLRDHPFGDAAEQLYKDGVQFDYVSDRQLANLKTPDQSTKPEDNVYRRIVVPKCEHMPPATLQRLCDLAAAGIVVDFLDGVPNDVPGLERLEERRAELKKARDRVTAMIGRDVVLDKGALHLGKLFSGAIAEPMVSGTDLRVVRRMSEGSTYLFVYNTGDKRIDQWVPVRARLFRGDTLQAVAIMDPMTGRAGMAKFRPGGEPGTLDFPKIYLQLEPHQSVILRTFKTNLVNVPSWNYYQSDGQPTELGGAWNVKFVQGGPTLPKSYQTDKLVSWTKSGGEEAQVFAGSALYTLHFDAPAQPAAHYALDLGDVRQSARVKLNGKDLGTVFVKPFRVPIDNLQPKGNTLEVEVTGTSANRIRDLDVRKVPWKIFYDTNIVTVNYKPFDASGWDIADQGLLGPVTLQPEKEIATP